MSGAEIVAVVSVLVSGVVGPYLASRWGLTRLRWETSRAREQEAGAVLQEAGIALIEAVRQLDRTNSAVLAADRGRKLAGTDFGSEESADIDPTELAKANNAVLEDLWKHETLIAMRFGTSAPVTSAFYRASMCVAEAMTVLEEVGYGASYDRERSKTFSELRRNAGKRQIEYQDAVSQRIGPGAVDAGPGILGNRRRRRSPALEASDEPGPARQA